MDLNVIKKNSGFPAETNILPLIDKQESNNIFSATNHTNNQEGKLRSFGSVELHEQEKILFKEECFHINGCIYEVNRKLGTGFLEAVYQEVLEIEFRRKNIPFESQKDLEILYDGFTLSSKYIVDIICYKKIIIELKAVSNITNHHKAQLMNYLAATGFNLGILINFNSFPKADIIRIVG